VFYPDDEDPQVCPNPLRSLAWWPVLLTQTWLGGTPIRGISMSWIPCMHSASPNPRGRLSCRRGYGTPGKTHWTVTLPMHALCFLSLVSFNRDFRPRSPGSQVWGPVVISSTYVLDYTRTSSQNRLPIDAYRNMTRELFHLHNTCLQCGVKC